MSVLSKPTCAGQPSLAELATKYIKRASNDPTIINGSTATLLSLQWTNPTDVLSVLLIIGGDIVQKALAQTSGGFFTPVCFSFGWVAYSFIALVGIIGDGRLLPVPDYPVRVYNLKNGYARDNKNWIVGRLLRDNEMRASKTQPLHGAALRISIYEAVQCRDSPAVAGSGRVKAFGISVMLVQLGIASIPVALYQEWGVLLITASGTLLAQIAGLLPQWKAEKLPSRQNSAKNFALTSGNGARDIMIILGAGNALDLEELSAAETPRSTRLWDSIDHLSKPLRVNGEQRYHSNGSPMRRAREMQGIPLGFWITILVSSVQSVFWLALLVTVAGLRSHTWFLLGVGGIGMFQNAMTAATSRDPKKRNLPLILVDTIISRTVMDGLMDLEVAYSNSGRHLLKEFFPGELRSPELEWWAGAWETGHGKAEYDRKRFEEKKRRGVPRSMQPRYLSTSLSWKKESEKKPEKTAMPPPPVPSLHGKEKAPMVRDPLGIGTETQTFPRQYLTSLDSNATSSWTPLSKPFYRFASTDVPLPRDGQHKIPKSNFGYNATERQDSGSSAAVSVQDMYKVYQSPDWAG